jgi:hypothetical protein
MCLHKKQRPVEPGYSDLGFFDTVYSVKRYVVTINSK